MSELSWACDRIVPAFHGYRTGRAVYCDQGCYATDTAI